MEGPEWRDQYFKLQPPPSNQTQLLLHDSRISSPVWQWMPDPDGNSAEGPRRMLRVRFKNIHFYIIPALPVFLWTNIQFKKKITLFTLLSQNQSELVWVHSICRRNQVCTPLFSTTSWYFLKNVLFQPTFLLSDCCHSTCGQLHYFIG